MRNFFSRSKVIAVVVTLLVPAVVYAAQLATSAAECCPCPCP
jgi:hypothetical protein